MFGKLPLQKDIPHSYPFLTHDTLRVFLDWDLNSEPTSNWVKANGGRFQNGDSIFVKTDYIHSFATTIDPFINKSYILVTGNSDYSAPGASYNPAPGNSRALMALLDSPRLMRWFAQNPGHVHQKLEALPIGLENSHFGRLGSPEVMADNLMPQVQICHDNVEGDQGFLSPGRYLPTW